MASFGDFLNTLGRGSAVAAKKAAQSISKGDVAGTLYNASPIGLAANTVGAFTAKPSPMQNTGPLGQNWFAPSGDTTGGGGGDTTGGGAYYGATGYAVDPNAAQVSALRGDVQGQRGTLDSLYNQLYGQTQGLAQEQRNNIDAQAAQDRAAMESQYANAQNQIGSMFGARGAYDSSYRANEQNAGTQTYQKNLGDYNANVEQSYGKVGEQYNKQYNAFKQQQDQINQLFDQAAQAGDVSTLAQIKDALLGHIQSLQDTSSGLKTNSQYAQQLKQIAPDATQVSKALSEKLQKLVTSSAPPEAKAAIAQGYISSAQLSDPNAQSYWNNYFQQLLQQSAPQPQQAPVLAGA